MPSLPVVCEFNLAFSVGTADRQSNMQMNKPVWIVEDKALKESEEGRKKLQQVADDHDKPNTASRLTIVHGGDFDKVTMHTAVPTVYRHPCKSVCCKTKCTGGVKHNCNCNQEHWQLQAPARLPLPQSKFGNFIISQCSSQ